jgi:hypothetical protein
MRDQVCDLRHPRFMLCDQSAQLLLCLVGLPGVWLVGTHLLIASFVDGRAVGYRQLNPREWITSGR